MNIGLRISRSGSRMKAYMEETNRMSNEEINRWNKAGLREIRDTKLEEESTKLRRVEGGVGGGKNS